MQATRIPAAANGLACARRGRHDAAMKRLLPAALACAFVQAAAPEPSAAPAAPGALPAFVDGQLVRPAD
jgi:hypothetical protein